MNGSRRKYVDRKCLLCLMKYVLTKKCYQNIYIYIYTNLLSTSIHGYQEKRKKKETSPPPGTRDDNISNHCPGGKRKNIIGQKKEKANFVTPVEKNQEICNQLVKRKIKTHRKLLQCYNYMSAQYKVEPITKIYIYNGLFNYKRE